jgi:glyoxylase-like metal-dependent hydrolase (beta-lactamase superfamily II)
MGAPEEIAPGLQRWSARHAEWHEDVASLAVTTSDGLVLIDPIAAPASLGTPAHVLLTVYWHARAAAAGESRVWAPRRSQRALRTRRIEVTDPFRAGDALPGDIQAFQTPRASEVVFWLPAQQTLVVGDVLLGAGAKPGATSDPLRLCPERWLGKGTHADLRAMLRAILELPVERVLVSHGQPVLSGARQALAAVVR